MANAETDDLKKQLNELRDEFDKLSKSIASELDQRKSEAKARLDQAGAWTQEQAEKAAGSARSRIRQKPLGSLLIALVAGVVVGLLIGNRKSV